MLLSGKGLADSRLSRQADDTIPAGREHKPHAPAGRHPHVRTDRDADRGRPQRQDPARVNATAGHTLTA